MNVLIVEDDEMILEGLSIALGQEGYRVMTAKTCAQALEILAQEALPDICLLDVMLPDGDGYGICREIRKKSDLPILFLTACEDEVHTVMALEIGADDYVAKPFRIRELLARMKAILRRTSGRKQKEESAIMVGGNQVFLDTGKVYAGNKEVLLTAMEYKLLLIFLNHRGRNLTREQILGEIWDAAGDFVNDNTLSVYVKRLRRKLGDTEEQPLITTVRGIGYRLEK
ncbi:MAG: response regulator transcription factor [Eubacteriales bacterium]|nr:response regulator transcription factor [Eubacteriales bacterium]